MHAWCDAPSTTHSISCFLTAVGFMEECKGEKGGLGTWEPEKFLFLAEEYALIARFFKSRERRMPVISCPSPVSLLNSL